MNNDFDDLDELERELGDTVRVALRRVAKTVADDQRPMGPGHGSSAGEVFLTARCRAHNQVASGRATACA